MTLNLGIVHFHLFSFVLKEGIVVHEVDFWGMERGCLKSYDHGNKKKNTVHVMQW